MAEQPIQLLAVEDDPSLSFVLEEALEHADQAEINAVMVSNLKEALGHLEESSFEVILLDLSLPDSDGLQTYSAVRGAAGDTPVIVLTGHEDPELAQRIRELGAQDFLLKGRIGSKTLIEKIRLHARQEGPQGPAGAAANATTAS